MEICKENKEDIISFLEKMVEETENYSKPEDLKLLKTYVKSAVKMYRRKDLYMFSILKLLSTVQSKNKQLKDISRKVNEKKDLKKVNKPSENSQNISDNKEFILWVNYSPRGSEDRFNFKSFVATESGIAEDEIKKIECYQKYSFIKLNSEKSLEAVLTHLNEKKYFNRVLKVNKKINK